MFVECDDFNDSSDISEHSAGTMESFCAYCGANYFKGEMEKVTYKKCCNDGQYINLNKHLGTPDVLRKLLQGIHPKSNQFFKHIRRYNNSLALASTSFNQVKFDGSGPPCLIVNGEMKHFLSPMNATLQRHNGYGELYVMDPEDAKAHRAISSVSQGCDQELLCELDLTLRTINPYAQSYRMMYELNNQLLMRGESFHTVRMWFVRNDEDSIRKFGQTTLGRNSSNTVYNEVAIVYSGEETDELKREICVYSTDYQPKAISHNRDIIDPLCYVLLFPFGDRGYNYNLQSARDKKVYERRNYLYHLSLRKGQFTPLLHSRKLKCQYICDAWLRVEKSQLQFIRNHQGQIRAELYAGLKDQLSRHSIEQNAKPGRCVILPSTFEGSSRHMYESYQDAMCLVREYGKADYFVTLTCNPTTVEQNLSRAKRVRPASIAKKYENRGERTEGSEEYRNDIALFWESKVI